MCIKLSLINIIMEINYNIYINEGSEQDYILLPCFLPLVSVFQDLEELKASFYPFPAGKGPATYS